LSYTTFGYKRLRTSTATLPANGAITVKVDVTNTGKRIGDEVVQLYVRHTASKVTRPKRDLRGFKRLTLKPGETRTVSFPLSARSLAYWDEGTHGWIVENAPVSLEVGASSADIRVRQTIRVSGKGR
jgi:beta-glucosidase